jgi:hypothetical protein
MTHASRGPASALSSDLASPGAARTTANDATAPAHAPNLMGWRTYLRRGRFSSVVGHMLRFMWALDLGTTNSLLARWDPSDDKPVLLEMPGITRRRARTEAGDSTPCD